jgi:hypothetical protein
VDPRLNARPTGLSIQAFCLQREYKSKEKERFLPMFLGMPTRLPEMRSGSKSRLLIAVSGSWLNAREGLAAYPLVGILFGD